MPQKHRMIDVVVVDRGAAGDLSGLEVRTPGWIQAHWADSWSDQIEWNFENRTPFDLQLGVGNFRVVDRYKGENEMREPPVAPLAGTPDKITVAHGGGNGTVRYHVMPQPKQPTDGEGRTFKYDIIDHSRQLVLLDPELEIYRDPDP